MYSHWFISVVLLFGNESFCVDPRIKIPRNRSNQVWKALKLLVWSYVIIPAFMLEWNLTIKTTYEYVVKYMKVVRRVTCNINKWSVTWASIGQSEQGLEFFVLIPNFTLLT